VRGGLCTGCGLCASLAGPDRVTMGLSPRGDLRPRFAEPLGPDEERRLVDACPGVSAVGPAAERLEPGTTLDPTWGPMRALHRAWAADPGVRHRAAAGGVMTALGQFLLASGKVDAVVHVRASPTEPLLTDAHVSRTPDEVLAGSQSRYGPAAPLVHVRGLLDAGERFAVLAKPCDVAAIRNLGRQDARVAAQVPYLVTLFCGGVPNVGTAAAITAHHGIPRDEVGLFRFRGEGWPGLTYGESRNRAVSFGLTYDEAWFDRSMPWRYDAQWRCKICPDAIGELADLSVPDGWLLDATGRPRHDEAAGVNLIVERTRAGSDLVAAATAAGYLYLAPLSHAELEQIHPDHRQRRLGEPARLAALRATRAARPRVSGYRMATMSRRAPPRLLLSQFRGAIRRVRQGQAVEPLVSPRRQAP